ncbi:MAG: winged helix-turn-helix domain-containing protein, partial [Terriglobales bacterium]
MGSSPPSPGVVRFGVFEADLRAGELRRSGHKVRIQELPFRALTVLLSRPGEVVSREELRQALWPEDVFVDFDQGISSAIRRLRDALGDYADNPRFVETVGRRGYRWIAPTHPALAEEAVPYRVPAQELPGTADDSDQAVSQAADAIPSGESDPSFTARNSIALTAGARKGRSRLRLWLATFVFIVAAAAAGLTGFFFWRSAHPPLISSVAVLPFDNLGAPADEAFSDGLTDEVAASISHLEGVRVTGRRSAYVFKGKHNDLRDIGARLNVEAVVEGSVQRIGERTHV